jgi:hypothetical protein
MGPGRRRRRSRGASGGEIPGPADRIEGHRPARRGRRAGARRFSGTCAAPSRFRCAPLTSRGACPSPRRSRPPGAAASPFFPESRVCPAAGVSRPWPAGAAALGRRCPVRRVPAVPHRAQNRMDGGPGGAPAGVVRPSFAGTAGAQVAGPGGRCPEGRAAEVRGRAPVARAPGASAASRKRPCHVSRRRSPAAGRGRAQKGPRHGMPRAAGRGPGIKPRRGGGTGLRPRPGSHVRWRSR